MDLASPATPFADMLVHKVNVACMTERDEDEIDHGMAVASVDWVEEGLSSVVAEDDVVACL